MAGVLIFALVVTTNPLAGRAALPDDINSIRLHGCGGRPGVKAPLRGTSKLDDVARRAALGSDLHTALSAAGYSAEQATLIHVAGSGGELVIGRMLDQHFCTQITEPGMREIGVAQLGAHIWIVLAAPLATPQPQDAPLVSQRVLELVNQARGRARSCGRKAFDATSALKLSAALAEAARAHSLDMATRDYFAHESPDGSTPESRVARTGYVWQVVGENIASGVPSAEKAVEGWLQSPAHCENLMDPRFTEMGVAYAVNPQNRATIFWTQVLAVPRPAPARARFGS